eukprot:6194033-Pleurochrysis_carterae.AAC.3
MDRTAISLVPDESELRMEDYQATTILQYFLSVAIDTSDNPSCIVMIKNVSGAHVMYATWYHTAKSILPVDGRACAQISLQVCTLPHVSNNATDARWRWARLRSAGARRHEITKVQMMPAGLTLYERWNRKSVGSPAAEPLRLAPPTSGIVNILID